MKNSILNYDLEELDEFIVPDYFTKKTDLYTFVKTYAKTHLDIYKINDNDKIERISYELYGTTDYWDLLILINDRNPLFQMPYNFDSIMSDTDLFLNTYINFTYAQAPLTDQNRVQELTTELLNNVETENELNRFIYVIKPQLLPDFIKILKDNQYI